MTDHAHLLATILCLRSSRNADMPMMIEAVARAACATDRAQPIAAALAAGRHTVCIIRQAAIVIERTAIA
jgi:hypothetical protein